MNFMISDMEKKIILMKHVEINQCWAFRIIINQKSGHFTILIFNLFGIGLYIYGDILIICTYIRLINHR